MKRVLILCTGNSCRSQMAEAIWNQLGAGRWQADSAGTKPAGFVHPLALRALSERGFSIAGLVSKSVDSLPAQPYDLAVTVCDHAQQDCPYFPANKVVHWPFFDPARSQGTEAEQLNVFRRIRDHIAWRINEFLASEPQSGLATQRDLALSLEEHDEIGQLIDAAFIEDLGGGLDATSEAIVPAGVTGTAAFITRRPGTLSGLAVCAEIVRRKSSGVIWQPLAMDGDRVMAGQTLGFLAGSAREILQLERTCLNFLGRLSGIASLTSEYVRQLEGTQTLLVDTRKTTPGWRRLEKYAVRCGGGTNHRMGLFDAILIKDNHLAVLRIQGDSPAAAVRRALREARDWIQKNHHQLPHGLRTTVQIEVDRLEMLPSALDERPDLILLDNMTPDQLRQAVKQRGELAPQVLLEASGGIQIDTIRSVAESGVDRISVGAITHSATNFDIGLDWQLGESPG